MGLVAVIAVALWAMLPAYIPNNVAVIAGGGKPIDGGYEWHGRRILGDGKTWRGTLVGAGAGLGLAGVLNLFRDSMLTYVQFVLPEFSLEAGIGLALGAMVGDIIASFLKRRFDHERGAAVPLVDQLDFVFGAFVLTGILAPDWFGETFTLPVIVAVLVVTPLLHVVTNLLAYALSLKSEPW